MNRSQGVVESFQNPPCDATFHRDDIGATISTSYLYLPDKMDLLTFLGYNFIIQIFNVD